MLVRHCDKCGKIIQKKDFLFKLEIDKFQGPGHSCKNAEDANEFPMWYDMCEFCFKDLRATFKEKD